MKRISTDAEYLNDGKVTVDADGIPVDLGYRGTGSPEGKITAPVGSVYTDTEATNGSVRWVKASGTGSTGWRDDYSATPKVVAIDGDGTPYASTSSGTHYVLTDESGPYISATVTRSMQISADGTPIIK